MAGWNISEVLGTLRNCQNPEEFDEAAKTLQRQVDSFEASDKVTYWCYLAAVKFDKRKDAEGALELLNRALRIPLISTEQKVEVLARMAANRIVIGQYSKGLQLHRQALELCESNCPESMHTIMGVYLKQESFYSECADVSQTLSFIYEAEGDIDQAVKQEKKALAFYNAEGAKSAHLKKFSEWRLAILKNTLPNTSNADAAEFEEKNNALKELFEFYPLEAVQESISELSNEKDEVLRKLRKTYLKYHRLNKPEMRGKLEKLKQLITELNTAAELPLIMRGEAAKLKEDDHPNIPPLPLNGQTTAPRVSFNDAPSSYRKPIIQSTTSRMVSLANQQSDRDWYGSNLIKINFGSEGEEYRYFYLKPGKERLYYCKNKKSKSKEDDYYELSDLEAVKVGKMTETMRKKEHSKKDETLCFSLELKDRTRDFAALSQEDLKMWVEKMRYMLSYIRYKKGKKADDSSLIKPPRPPSILYDMPNQSTIPPQSSQQESQQSQYGKGTVLLSRKR